MIPEEWIRYNRRDDGELIGYIEMTENDWFITRDIFGQPLEQTVDYLDAEESLERLGLRYLMEPWILYEEDITETQVRILEVTATHVTVSTAKYGVVGDYGREVTLVQPVTREVLAPFTFEN